MIASLDKGDAADGAGAVRQDGMVSCDKFMWQILLRMCYSIHDG